MSDLLNYFDDEMNQTGTFTRWDGSLDSLGSPDLSTENFDDLYTDIKCFLNPMSTAQKVMRGKKVSDRMFFLICKTKDNTGETMSLLESDRFKIGSTEYDIIHSGDIGNQANHLELELEQVV